MGVSVQTRRSGSFSSRTPSALDSCSGTSRGTMAEEMPHAYKDVAEVVETMDLAGISKKVARFRPVGVIKG